MNNNEINFRTPRTVVGTVMETAVAIQVLALWLLILYLSKGAPAEQIQSLVSQGLMGTVLPLVMLVLCYFPKTFNIPVRRPRVEHYLLTIQLIRICSILIMPIMLAEAWAIGRPADGVAAAVVKAVVGCVLALVVGYHIFRMLRIR